jgi:hypothetical protein
VSKQHGWGRTCDAWHTVMFRHPVSVVSQLFKIDRKVYGVTERNPDRVRLAGRNGCKIQH